VANKAQAPAVQEVSRKDFETSIERKVDVVLPFDAKIATQAAKLGQPFAKAANTPKLNQPLSQLLSLSLAAVEGAAEPDAQASGSLLDKLGGLKALLAKAPKEKASA
jgi:pilus assembly protein CpaE